MDLRGAIIISGLINPQMSSWLRVLAGNAVWLVVALPVCDLKRCILVHSFASWFPQVEQISSATHFCHIVFLLENGDHEPTPLNHEPK